MTRKQMKKYKALEIIMACLYAICLVPYIVLTTAFFGVIWSVILLAITLFLYWKFLNWIEEE